MNFNSILFPAPKCSYSIESLSDELIWIPRYSKENNSSHQNTSNYIFIGQEPFLTTMQSNESHVIKPKSPDTAISNVSNKDFENENDSFISIPANYFSPHKILKVRSKYAPPKAGKTNAQEPLRTRQTAESKHIVPHSDTFDDIDLDCTVPNEHTEENFDYINEFEECEDNVGNSNPNSPGIKIKTVPLKPMKNRRDLLTQTESDRNLANTKTYIRSPTIDHGYEQSRFSTPTLMAKNNAKGFSNPVWNLNKCFDPSHQVQSRRTINLELNQMQPFHKRDSLDPIKMQPSRSDLDGSFEIGHQINAIQKTKAQDLRKNNQNVNKHARSVSLTTVESYIPCLLLQSEVPSDKILIYFHGNGEDINSAYELAAHLRDNLMINTLTIEYPGYGVYKGVPEEETIMKDAEAVYDYLTNKLNIEHKNILVCGRSIGSGPATYLCSQREVGALILVSAFTSIRAVVKDFAGTWAQYLIKQRFNNIEAITKVTSPIFLVHGQKDRLIPFSHSEELHSMCKAASELVLPKEMDHIEFDFQEDLTGHLKNFLQRCGIKLGRPRREIYFPKLLFKTPEVILSRKKKYKRETDETETKKFNSKSMVEADVLPIP